MCAPILGYIAAAAVIGLGVAMSESDKAEKQARTYGPNPEKEQESARRSAEMMNSRAQKPTRANAADALYGNIQNPIRESGPTAGTASTGITTSQSTAAPTALTLGKNDLLGQ